EENGIAFQVKLMPIDEDALNQSVKHTGVSKRFAKKYGKMLAIEKLKPFVGVIQDGAVITADSVAWCDGVILEKPITKEKCREQHEFISGKKTYALTSHAVYYNGQVASFVKKSLVGIEKLPSNVLDEICNEPETLFCAGYRTGGAIRNYVWWEKGHGNNIRGLDIGIVRRLLKKVGFPDKI
ncbi:MAG: Maf family protein, partial [Firmicutes bacterium]|nr:Maf family protein [Bacillota bacterium]